MTESTFHRPLALALSGGGVRAMAFHTGVLRALAERSLLESVTHLSTVSGGSLLIGCVLQEAGYLWPSSEDFLARVYPALQTRLCSRSLTADALWELTNPANWRLLLSRANLVSRALQKRWGIHASLSDLPARPEWSINGTTAETGKRFRFKRDSVGDYTLGYAKPNGLPLSHALAVSAAFPGGIGPLTLRTKGFSWSKRPQWQLGASQAAAVELPYRRLRLYDGGVYDNLGLEPFFDAGRGVSKIGNGPLLVVSDAGAPLMPGFSFLKLNPWRLKRVSDIISDQARSVRVRTFMHYINSMPNRGMFVPIAPPGYELDSDAMIAATFPTTLRKLLPQEFDAIAAWGHKSATVEFSSRLSPPEA